MSCRRGMTTRTERVLLSMSAVLTSLTMVGIWLASPARADAAPRGAPLPRAFVRAINRVASAPALHYATASRGVSLAVDVTPDGYAFGHGAVDGVGVGLMRVGARTYVSSPASAPPRLARRRAVVQVAGHWIAGVPFYEAAMRRFRGSEELARTLRRAVESGSASFGTVCLGRALALRASTPRGVLYVSRSVPHRVLRWVQGKRAASVTHDRRPRRGHCRSSRARAQAARDATPRPRARAARASPAVPLDMKADSRADARQLYQELVDHAAELSQAFDDSVDLSLAELGGPLNCLGAECTSVLLVKTVTTPPRATGTIALSANGEFTANGIPIGTCAVEGVAPPNGVTTLLCTAPTPLLPEILATSEGPVLVQSKGVIQGIATLEVDVQAKTQEIKESEAEHVPPDTNTRQDECAMRFQVQLHTQHLDSEPVVSPRPITVEQAVGALEKLRLRLGGDMRRAAAEAFARTKRWIQRRPPQGVAGIGNVRRDPFEYKKERWRLDTENSRCKNLVS